MRYLKRHVLQNMCGRGNQPYIRQKADPSLRSSHGVGERRYNIITRQNSLGSNESAGEPLQAEQVDVF